MQALRITHCASTVRAFGHSSARISSQIFLRAGIPGNERQMIPKVARARSRRRTVASVLGGEPQFKVYIINRIFEWIIPPEFGIWGIC